VIEVSLNSGFRHSAHAVERPKAPLPTISTDAGISAVDEEDIAHRLWGTGKRETENKTNKEKERACLGKGTYLDVSTIFEWAPMSSLGVASADRGSAL
jgi:hypothetical protein